MHGNPNVARTALSIPALTALVIVGLSGACVSTVMPAVSAGFVAAYHISGHDVAWISSAELWGLMASTAVGTLIVGRYNWRLLSAVPLAICLVLDLLTTLTHSVEHLVALRLCAGFCEGMVVTVQSAGLGTSSDPVRNFSIFITAMMAMSAAFFVTMPILVSLSPIDGPMCALGLFAICSLIVVPFLPPRAAAAQSPTIAAKVRLVPLILGTASIFVFMVGVGLVWPLMSVIGQQLGIASKDIGWIFGQATIVTLVAVLFGSWLNIRIGRAIPLMAGAAAVLFSVIAISLHQRGLFSLIVVSFLSGWMFSFPYYFGLVGQADPIGRASAFGMSVQFLGLAVGPPIGAMLMGDGAGFGNAELAAALFVVACVLGIAGDRSLRRATAEAPNYLVTQ